MEITREQMKEALYNKKMVELFVSDIEYGIALGNMDNLDQDPYFTKSDEEKAKELVEWVQNDTKRYLENIIKEVLKENK